MAIKGTKISNKEMEVSTEEVTVKKETYSRYGVENIILELEESLAKYREILAEMDKQGVVAKAEPVKIEKPVEVEKP